MQVIIKALKPKPIMNKLSVRNLPSPLQFGRVIGELRKNVYLKLWPFRLKLYLCIFERNTLYIAANLIGFGENLYLWQRKTGFPCTWKPGFLLSSVKILFLFC